MNLQTPTILASNMATRFEDDNSADEDSQDAKMHLDNPEKTVEQVKHGEIDESLYSRQL
jgi:hypothetical protein